MEANVVVTVVCGPVVGGEVADVDCSVVDVCVVDADGLVVAGAVDVVTGDVESESESEFLIAL